ncbi:MAG: hypothetical protein U0R64_01490 [Candidatus Nanopelagicales bacterium]
MRRPTLALAAVAFAGLALAGCSSNSSTTTASPAAPSVPTEIPTEMPSELPSDISSLASGYSDAIEAGFMSTCPSSARESNSQITEQQAQDYCGCVYRAFEAKLPFDQFLAMNTGTTSESAKKLVTECVNDPQSY